VGKPEPGLAAKVGIHTRPPTLLAHLLQLPLAEGQSVRVLGIDDWCWKRGRRYGTILVDLEKRKIIDLLPDRKATTVVKWLAQHPQIEIISRDRGTDYAAAAREGAPQAKQVVHRFHLVKNLAEVLQVLLARCRSEIRQAAPQQEEPPRPQTQEKEPPPLPTAQTWQQRTPPQVERRHQARQASRDDQYCQISELRACGLTYVEIAERVGMAERTVRTWLKQGAAPTWKRRSRRRSIFDPYAAYVLERWQQGVREGKQLFEEIRAQGFSGSIRVVNRFLQALVTDPPPTAPVPPASPLEHFSATTATWLFIRDLKDLTAQERIELFLICQQSPTANRAYLLTQAFLTMVRERRGHEFEGWVQAIEKSQLPELQRFCYSLLKDQQAVEAGLICNYSNGPVEAQVHKLKLVKRQGFGRAKLPLLKQRLLHSLSS
jgi:transposase